MRDKTRRRKDLVKLAQDALKQGQSEAALFWAETLLSISDTIASRLVLAQVCYELELYPRAFSLLLQSKKCKQSVYLSAMCCIKMKKYQQVLDLLNEVENLNASSTVPTEGLEPILDSPLVHIDASLLHVKALAHFHIQSLEKAKHFWIQSVLADNKCYESIAMLLKYNMLTESEESNLIHRMSFKDHFGPNASFIELLYETKIKKFDSFETLDEKIQELVNVHQVNENRLLLYTKAELLFIQCRYKESFENTKRLLDNEPYSMDCLPLHVANLAQLNKSNDLFLLSYDLIEKYPSQAMSWFAIGTYYLLIRKYTEARQFFGKATTLDPSFAVAWVGFGHTLAADGEHDQAISAYSTAAKYMRGSHLPSLYMAMQYIHQQHLGLAEEYLTISYQLCRNDPCLLNEMGVLKFQNGKLNEAKDFFIAALDILQLAKGTDIWESAMVNLGHCYRKLGMEHLQKRAEHYSKALMQFETVLKSNKDHFGAIAGMGYVFQLQGQRENAIEAYHRALALQMDDVFCTEMMQALLDGVNY